MVTMGIWHIKVLHYYVLHYYCVHGVTVLSEEDIGIALLCTGSRE